MADDDFKPDDDFLASLLDRDEADRRAEGIANDPEVRRLREEIERLEREAKEEEARQEAERMAKPAPVSDVAIHVQAAVPVSVAPRLTAAKIKLDTELRRLRAPPEVVVDGTDRGRNTVLVRRGVQDDGFAVAPAQEVAAQTRSKRAGLVIALVGVALVGGVIIAASAMGGGGEVRPQVAASVVAPSLPVPELRVEPSGATPPEPMAPVTSAEPVASAATPVVTPSSKAVMVKTSEPAVAKTEIPPKPSAATPPAPPPSAKPASSSDFNGIRF